MFVLVPLGLMAGFMTTLAGLGGGQIATLVLSLLWDPRRALVVTAPALLVGNLHRLWLYWDQLDRRLAAILVAGILPGALLGGAVTVALPERVIQGALVLSTLLALARGRCALSFRPRARLFLPISFGIGVFAASAGGTALLLGPLLIAAGLTGSRYAATLAIAAAALHVGRLAGYGAGGMVHVGDLGLAALLTAAIVVGNTVAARLRPHVGALAAARLELSALVACVALALAGIGK